MTHVTLSALMKSVKHGKIAPLLSLYIYIGLAMKTKYLLIGTLSSLLLGFSSSGNALEGTTYRIPFDSGSQINIEPNSNYNENTRTVQGFDYNVDKFNSDDGSHQFGWLNHSHSCGITNYETTVRINHGAYTCWRALMDRETGTYYEFDIQPGDDFDISFNANKTSYGSNYRARAYMSGIDGGLWYWYYNRDGADFFRSPIGQVGISEGSNRRYRLQKEGTTLRMYVEGSLVKEGEWELDQPIKSRLYIGVNNSRLYFRNLKVEITRSK